MKFQITTDYAIRILQHLHETRRGGIQPAATIAAAVGMTYPFFIKIANQLKQAGLICSIQGRHGGYLISKPGEQISFYDVFLATEDDTPVGHCHHSVRDDHRCTWSTIGDCPNRGFTCQMQLLLIQEMKRHSIVDLPVAPRSTHLQRVFFAK
jgi:Rrf2 family iron-responsive transcriptional regulator